VDVFGEQCLHRSLIISIYWKARRGEDHEYVKIDGSDGARYILRYDRSRDEWEIQLMESPPPMTGR
jgi:hypothetical protein